MDHAILRDPRLLAELRAHLDGSNEPETLLARDLARSYGLLARELATVRLSRIEAEVLHVAVRGAERARVADTPFGSLAEAVEAEVRRVRGLDLRSRWALNDDALIAAVAAWTPAQTLAVLDACERVRAAAYRGSSTFLAELLREAAMPRGENPE